MIENVRFAGHPLPSQAVDFGRTVAAQLRNAQRIEHDWMFVDGLCEHVLNLKANEFVSCGIDEQKGVVANQDADGRAATTVQMDEQRVAVAVVVDDGSFNVNVVDARPFRSDSVPHCAGPATPTASRSGSRCRRAAACNSSAVSAAMMFG